MNTISIKRIALLMQKNIYENFTNFLRGIAIYFGIVIVMIISTIYKGFNAINGLPQMYFTGLIILGMIVAGTAFSNFRSKEKSMSYLALPATTLEKLLAEFIVSTVIFFVAYTAIFYVFNFLIIIFGDLVGIQFEINFVNIFTGKFFENYRNFIIIQSVLFAGAATFTKRPLLRTGFTLFMVGVVYFLYALILTYFVEKYIESNFAFLHVEGMQTFDPYNNRVQLPYSTAIIKTAEYLFSYALAPIFWVVAYLKFKEKQV